MTFAELEPTLPGKIGGWMCHAERDELFRIASAMQPGQRFMEIGVYGGTTLSLFALLAPAGCDIIGMDSWENDTPNRDPDTDEAVDLRTFCERNLIKNGVRERVTLIDGSSHLHGPLWTKSLDVLIIDGDHTYAGALQDLRDFAPHVKPGGLLIMDDYWSGDEVKGATDAWRGAEPADRWVLEWGGELARNETDGLISKMLVYRRAA